MEEEDVFDEALMSKRKKTGPVAKKTVLSRLGLQGGKQNLKQKDRKAMTTMNAEEGKIYQAMGHFFWVVCATSTLARPWATSFVISRTCINLVVASNLLKDVNLVASTLVVMPVVHTPFELCFTKFKQ